MKILHLADLHCNKAAMAWVAGQMGNHDVTVIAGDFLNMFSPAMGEQIPQVRTWLKSLPGLLVTCSGNHDFFPSTPTTRAYGNGRWLRSLMRKHALLTNEADGFVEVAEREGIWADGARFALGGWRWEVCGWSQSKPGSGRGADILVSHAPPSNCAVAVQACHDHGDGFLTQAVNAHQPRLVLSGHIHEPKCWHGFIGATLCLNAGCDLRAKIPAHIVIDTDQGTIVWRAADLGAKQSIPLPRRP